MDLRVDAQDDGRNLTTVTLSERNLRHLLAAFEQAPGVFNALARNTEAGKLLVQVEADADHYKERTPGPGMEPWL